MRWVKENTMATIALVYTRVSTDEQADSGHSLDAQLADARRYAAGMGWIIGTEFQDVLSGRRDDRPQYQALLAEARRLRGEGRPVAVVVAALDRFGRRLLERVRSREELAKLGVETHSVREGGLVSDLVSNVLGAVAQEEVRRLGERVSATRRHVNSGGWKFPGRCPWGYAWRPATDQERAEGAPKSALEPDPMTAPFVVEAFRRAAAGETNRGIAHWIAALPDAARGGRVLGGHEVAAVLKAPVYVGRVDDPSEPDVLARAHGRWLALIDDATFAAVRAKIGAHKKMPPQASGKYVLTGLIRCSRCGTRMVGCKRAGLPPVYLCQATMRGARSNDIRCQASARADQLEAGVLAEVAAVIETVASTDPRLRQGVRRAWDALQRPTERAAETGQRQGLEREAERARKRLVDAARMLVDGVIDKAGYEALRDEERVRLDAAEEALAGLGMAPPRPKTSLPPIEAVIRQAGGWGRIIASGDIASKRELLGQLVDKVQPERTGWGKYRPEITWSPLGAALRSAAGPNSAEAA
jgi:DNA invertase Pin-like site-specific DNA recombinase